MDILFRRMREASRNGPPPSVADRKAVLDSLARMLRENGPAIIAAISDDFKGRSETETRLLEIVPALGAIRHAKRHLASWVRPQRRTVDWAFQPARAWIRHEPLGVVGIISPWNYPLLLSLSPLVDAIAAGNRVLLKPSELTPAFADLLAGLIARYTDPGRIAVITGGVEVARAFSGLPFDHLLFTGSTAVGRQVMAAAAPNLTPVTLELGGKSPALVCPDYPLDKAAGSIAFGKFLNAGQTCVAPDYALVPAGRERDFADAVLARVRTFYPDVAGNPHYSAVISERHRERLLAALAEAEAGGATILRHGEDRGGRVAPSVVLNAPPGCLLLREEIFGPILPVAGYRDLEEARAGIARGERPLALYCFTGDRRTEQRVLDGSLSGGVTVNGTLLHVAQDGLPFGGVGASGMGAYHGIDGFRRLSHARAVHRIGGINGFERLGPPWGRLADWAARLLTRRPV
ncbi:MAG: coniferyl aldehyde dehydrogenase [Telmatospirillum sp.]|nr:coniferyl aldehyde dehydrogenase [Telmatospirillum sp.]